MRTLVTARLDLVPGTLADVPALWELWTDPDVRRWLWDDQVIPLERARALVADGVATARASGLGLWTVRRRGAGEIVGFCGLLPNTAGEAELLYGLAPACWGRGSPPRPRAPCSDMRSTTSGSRASWPPPTRPTAPRSACSSGSA